MCDLLLEMILGQNREKGKGENQCVVRPLLNKAAALLCPLENKQEFQSHLNSVKFPGHSLDILLGSNACI